MTKNQIEYSIKKLIDNKVLVKAVYNDNSYDRTSWYAFCKEPEDLAVIPNPYKKEEKQEDKPEDEEKDKEEDKKDESDSEKSEKQDGNSKNGDSDFQESISEFSEMEDEEFQNGNGNFQKSHADNLTDFAPDESANNLTNTACVKDFTTPYGLLNYSHWNWDSFKAAYIHWYTLLTGRPVNNLIQTLPKKDIGSDKLSWLENAFKNRKVNAGVAIFETLEYIAQNKGCQENVYLRSANYYDGVIMRLSDMYLAENDGISTEGREYYLYPMFDYFKY